MVPTYDKAGTIISLGRFLFDCCVFSSTGSRLDCWGEVLHPVPGIQHYNRNSSQYNSQEEIQFVLIQIFVFVYFNEAQMTNQLNYYLFISDIKILSSMSNKSMLICITQGVWRTSPEYPIPSWSTWPLRRWAGRTRPGPRGRVEPTPRRTS